MPPRPLPRELTLEVGLDEPEGSDDLRKRVAATLGVAESALPPIALRKRSLDARRGRVRFHLLFEIGARDEPLGGRPPREVSGEPRVIVVGEGPAGLFCAY